MHCPAGCSLASLLSQYILCPSVKNLHFCLWFHRDKVLGVLHSAFRAYVNLHYVFLLKHEIFKEHSRTRFLVNIYCPMQICLVHAMNIVLPYADLSCACYEYSFLNCKRMSRLNSKEILELRRCTEIKRSMHLHHEGLPQRYFHDIQTKYTINGLYLLVLSVLEFSNMECEYQYLFDYNKHDLFPSSILPVFAYVHTGLISCQI